MKNILRRKRFRQTKLTILTFLIACLLTGCGETENTENDKHISEQIEMEATPNPTEIPLMTPEPEEDAEDTEEEVNISEWLSSRDLSDIIYPIKDAVYNEVKTGKKNNKKKQKINFEDAPILENNDGVISAVTGSDYKTITLDKLEKNLKQKKFKGRCIKVEKYPIDLYNMAQIHDGDVNDIDVEFKSNFEDIVDGENNISMCIFDMYYKDRAKNELDTYRLKIPFGQGTEVDTGDAPIVSHAIYDKYVAIAVWHLDILGVCIIDLDDKSFKVVNFLNVIEEEFYNEDNYKNFEEIFEITFVSENKLALKFKSGQIIVYDIKNDSVINNIKTARMPYEDSVSDKMKLRYDVSLDDGICNLTYKNDDGTYDYYAIDLDTMQIVSHVENPDRYFIDFMGLYKDGVTYFTNSYGLYAYNPETKGYDCIYDQMENDTEYTWEKIKDDKYRDVFVKPLFKGNDIYLCRGIRYADDCVDWEEAVCKKLTIE